MSNFRRIRAPILTIREGDIYIYVADYPPGCKWHEYRALKLVDEEPLKTKKVIIEALTGPDKWLWFICSLSNFANRYAPKPPDPPPEEKAAGTLTTGTGA